LVLFLQFPPLWGQRDAQRQLLIPDHQLRYDKYRLN